MSGLRTLAKAGAAPRELQDLAALNLAGLGAQRAAKAAREPSRELRPRRRH